MGFSKSEFVKIFCIALLSFISALFGSFTGNLNTLKPLVKAISTGKEYKTKTQLDELDLYWAKEIVKGGYILHIRHAMREKFSGSVHTHDAIELLDNKDARNTEFYRAVCLTERGIIDSKAVGRVFDLANIKLSYVVSSPSCRSRETAIYAFNKIDQIEPSTLHRTAQPKSQHISLGNAFRKALDNIPIVPGKNILISGHAGTLQDDLYNKVGIVDIDETATGVDDRLETGIAVIERKNGKYIARHSFKSIRNISIHLLNLPVETDKKYDKYLFEAGDKYDPKNINSGLIYVSPD